MGGAQGWITHVVKATVVVSPFTAVASFTGGLFSGGSFEADPEVDATVFTKTPQPQYPTVTALQREGSTPRGRDFAL